VVIVPWPTAPRWPQWAVIPFLISADVLNTVLSAILAFSGRVLYPYYTEAERICKLSPLQDQVAAGAEMWVLNSLVFLAPAMLVTMRLLSPRSFAAAPSHRAGLTSQAVRQSGP
jgi:cytochrome c oxidase assembly factor CtaG